MTSSSQRPLLARRTGELQLSAVRKIFEMSQSMPNVIHLEIGQPDFETPAYIRNGIKDDLDTGSYTSYTATAGYLDVRQAIAANLRQERHWLVDPATQITATAGGAAALYFALMATVDPGDEVLLPDPGYPQYTQMTLMMQGRPVFYRLLEQNGFQPDLAEMERSVTPRSKAIMINTPSNPTGVVWGTETLEQVAALAKRYNLAVISDEVYDEIVYDGRQATPIATLPGMAERTVAVNSCSKSFSMTGWRLGYAIGPAAIISQVVKLQSFVYTCPSSISQRAALHAFKGPNPTPAMLAEFQRRRDWLIPALNTLPGVHCTTPQGAFYAFPNVSSFGISSEQVATALLEQARVTTVPGSAYGPSGEGYLRLSYATALDQLKEAVERMRSVLPLR